MHVSATMRRLRVHAATSTILKSPSRLTLLRTSQSQCRRAHASSHQNPSVPPPLTATPLRRSAANRRASLRRTSMTATTAIASSSSSTNAAHATSTLQWNDMIASHTAGAPLSRVALSEGAALCLSVELPKCYAVYRPCDSGKGDSRHATAAPHHFVELLRHLRSTPSLAIEARRVAEVLVDLLNKPPNPHYPGPWDVTRQEVRDLKATAVTYVMEGLSTGDEALLWLVRLLGLSDTLADVDASAKITVHPPVLVKMAVMERIECRDAAATARRVHVEDPDAEWLLSCSSVVVGAIAAAMLRSTAHGVKADALELLEVAALSRLSRGSSACPSPLVSGLQPTATQQSGPAAVLFNEAVAVHCAEVAAVRGDVETVTRLIFLLYRAHGALGFATLAEHQQQRRLNCGSLDSPPRWGVGGLFPLTPPWVRSKWWGGASLSRETDNEEEVDSTDVRFEQAAVRLLKSVMHAALYHHQRSGDSVEGTIEEALSLWDGLHGGTSWSGLAAMGTEFLTYLVDQHTLVTATTEREDIDATDTCLQQAGLHVYTQLCRAVALRHRASAKEVLHHCIALMMRLFSTHVGIREEGNVPSSLTEVAVPTVLIAAAAERILRLFDHVKEAPQQEALLPYALAASLTVLSTAATVKTYQPPAGLFGGLARYFSEVQTLHFYCVASGNAGQPSPHVALCGSQILLHVFLLSHVSLGAWAREDGELASFLQRLRGVDGTNDSRGVQHHDGQGAQLLAWLRVSGPQQRQLLWSLLMSLKQHDDHWCGAMLNLFASPASSTAVFAAAAATVHFPSSSRAEMQTVMSLLYKCGNTDNPVHARETLDYVVSTCAQIPVRTITLTALTEQLQRKSATDSNSAVLILTRESLRVIVQRRESAVESVFEDPLKDLVALLQPLLRESATRGVPSFVLLVLTPACLLELRRMQGQDKLRYDDIGVVQALHAALARNATQKLYQVAVASAWPLLPTLAAALIKRSDLRAAADGLQETAAAARHLAQSFPKESRPAICLWAEEEITPSTPSSLSVVRANLLQRYGAREVSTRRAHMEKAKSDIFSLLRGASSANARQSDLCVTADAASAETSAARRVRSKSLLSAVSPKRKGQRTL